MSGGKEDTFSLTLVMNKEKSKVLFASVDNSFADILLSFLTIPLGQILQLFQDAYKQEAPSIGSLKTLYTGLQNLADAYFETKAGKLMLLNPKCSLDYEQCIKLKLNRLGSGKCGQSTSYYSCDRCSEYASKVSSYYAGAICTGCANLMTKIIFVKDSPIAREGGEVFTKQAISFIITDDLRMVPNVTVGSFAKNLENLGMTDDIRGAHLETVIIGYKQMIDFLKVMLLSLAPLTDYFLHNGKIVHQCVEQMSLRMPKKDEKCSSSMKMKVTAVVQKSSSKFLFVQAANDFVDFLFSLPTIPLGQVERLLGINSCVGSTDNLYRSISELAAEKCLMTVDTKDLLLSPKIPHSYLSKYQIFSLIEKQKPKIYFHNHKKISWVDPVWSFSYFLDGYNSSDKSFEDPKGKLGMYVKGNRMYMVTDDLTVTPLFMHSTPCTLMALGVPLTDIEEFELNIGLEEALSILKASLTSTCALSKGLNLNCTTLRKKPNKNTKVDSQLREYWISQVFCKNLNFI